MATGEPAGPASKADATPDKTADPKKPSTPSETNPSSPNQNHAGTKTTIPKQTPPKTMAERPKPDPPGKKTTTTAPLAKLAPVKAAATAEPAQPTPSSRSSNTTSAEARVGDVATDDGELNSPVDGVTPPNANTTDDTQSPSSQDPPPDTYIAVMGQTGTGKTSFINNAAGANLKVGHDLESCTIDIEIIKTTIAGRTIQLIDTPGFDDSVRCDADILEIISEYLREAYTQKIFLTGIIYIQKITDNRMQGSAVRCLRLLKKLCGKDYYGNIVLVTTMWDEIQQLEDGERREDQLRKNDAFWGELLTQGATFQRHIPVGQESAIKILKHLLDKTPEVLQFQREIFNAHGVISDTSAGQEVMIFYANKLKEVKKQLEESQKVIDTAKREIGKFREERRALEAKFEKERKALESRMRGVRAALEGEIRREKEEKEALEEDMKIKQAALAEMKREREEKEAQETKAKEEQEALEADMEKKTAALEAEIKREREERETREADAKEKREALEEELRKEKEAKEALELKAKREGWALEVEGESLEADVEKEEAEIERLKKAAKFNLERVRGLNADPEEKTKGGKFWGSCPVQ